MVCHVWTVHVVKTIVFCLFKLPLYFLITNGAVSLHHELTPFRFKFLFFCENWHCVVHQMFHQFFHKHHNYNEIVVIFLEKHSSKLDKPRVSVQGVKSLGGHFACLYRGFEFYEVKKNCHYFSKRKWKYFYTFYHFYSEKSSKRAK